MALPSGGQTLNDRFNAARYALAGQGLARTVCKATTEELMAPKKKHLDYLLQCTYEANVSIPQMANFLIERTTHNSWVVVFKALITVHHLMCYGNERFTQYLASSNCSFQLSNFLDRTGVKGYDMSTYIRRYAKYLNEKALSYRLVALDFAKMKRGKEEGSLRTMTNDKLLKTLPILQNQVDALLEFDCTAMDLSNGVINAAFMLLFRDLIRLFACYNDGIINLLEKYFEMQRKQCREALDIYKKFLIRMDKVAEFLKVAENVGVDKVDIPDLTKAPSSLLEALEAHLNSLEAKGKRHKEKHGKGNVENQPAPANLDDDQLKKALEEEAAMMNQLKFDRLLSLESEIEFQYQSEESNELIDKAELSEDTNNTSEVADSKPESKPKINKKAESKTANKGNYRKLSESASPAGKTGSSCTPEKHVKDKPFNPFLDTSADLATFDTSSSSTGTAKSGSNDIIDLFGSNGASSQPSNNLLTNQTSNLLFSSNQNGALHTQANTLNSSGESGHRPNQSVGSLLENGSSTSLGFKPSSDLLGVLANNSQSFHSNIYSQNLANPYPQLTGLSGGGGLGGLTTATTLNTAPASVAFPSASSTFPNASSLAQLQSPPPPTLATSVNHSMQTSTAHTYPTMQTQNQNLNINGNNLLMNPAFTTAAASNPFASGFAQPAAGTNVPSGTTSNNFEPNFANAFGSSSNPANGSASKKPARPPIRPPPPTSRPAFDAFGDILQPQKSGSHNLPQPQPVQSNSNSNSMLSMMNNLNNNNLNSNKQSTILKGDLDSTLANLALNLDLKPKKMPTKY